MPKTAARLLAFSLVFAVLAGLLNFSRTPPFASFYAEFSSLMAFGIASIFLLVLLPNQIKLSKPAVLATVLGLAILAVQWFTGLYDYSWLFFTACFFLVLIFIYFSLGRAAAEDENLRDLLVKSLCFGVLLFALFNSLLQTLQFLGFETAVEAPNFMARGMPKCRPSGHIWQANHANTFALMGAIASVYFWRIRQSFSAKWAIPLLLICLWGSVLAGSRMGWLQMGIVALLLLPFAGVLRASKKQIFVAILAGFVAFFLLNQLPSLFGFATACDSSAARLAGGLGGAAQGNWYRIELYRQAFMVWTEAPIFGVGFGKFMGHVYFAETALDMRQPFDFYTHNLPAQLLAETGLAGLLLFLAVLVLSFKTIFYRLKTNRQAPEFFPFLAWILIIGAHSMLEQPLHYLYFLIPFALICGVLNQGSNAGEIVTRKRLWVVIVAAVLLYANIVHRDYLKSKATMQEIMLAINEGAGGSHTERAISLHNEVGLFHPYTRLMLIPIEQNPDNAKLLRNLPHGATILWQAVLEARAGDLQAADLTLLRLQVFYAKEESTKLLKFAIALADKEPAVYEDLARIATARLEHPPKER